MMCTVLSTPIKLGWLVVSSRDPKLSPSEDEALDKTLPPFASRPIKAFTTHASVEDRTLMTVREVAALDNCSVKTVRRAIAAGLLQAIRVGPGGRLLRISKAAHLAYRRGRML